MHIEEMPLMYTLNDNRIDEDNVDREERGCVLAENIFTYATTHMHLFIQRVKLVTFR